MTDELNCKIDETLEVLSNIKGELLDKFVEDFYQLLLDTIYLIHDSNEYKKDQFKFNLFLVYRYYELKCKKVKLKRITQALDYISEA